MPCSFANNAKKPSRKWKRRGECLRLQYKANIDEKQRAMELEKQHQLMEAENSRSEASMRLVQREKELLELIDQLKKESASARQMQEEGNARIDDLTEKLTGSESFAK